jgi:hypothetical protein
MIGLFLLSVPVLRAEETKKADEATTEKPAEEEKKAEEPKVTGAGSIGFYNRYIFRGYEIGTENFVAQPSLSASYRGFTATFWGNFDGNQRNTTSAVFSDPGSSGIDEVDITLSYTYTIQKLSLTGGYIYYDLSYAKNTQEFFLTAALDVFGKPTISAYQDVDSYPGTYLNLSFAQSFPIYKDITIDLGASFGYMIGEGNYWKTYEQSTASYTGKKFSDFLDGMVKFGFTIPVTKAFSIAPSVQYWFPLSGNAKKTYGYNAETDLKIPYNPNGYIASNWLYGVGFTYSF